MSKKHILPLISLLLLTHFLNAQQVSQNSGFSIFVKFKHTAINDFVDGKPIFSKKLQKTNQNSIFKNLYFEQLLDYSTEEHKLFRENKKTTTSNKSNNYEYKGLVSIKNTHHLSHKQAEDLAKKLEKLPYIEYVECLSNKVTPGGLPNSKPLVTALTASQTKAMMMPRRDRTNSQDYLKVSNTSFGQTYLGMGFRKVWKEENITGQGVKVAVIDGDFTMHEDLVSNKYKILSRPTGIRQKVDPRSEHQSQANFFKAHGTATCGVIFARNNNFGVTGGAYGIDKLYGISGYNGFNTSNQVQSFIKSVTKGIRLATSKLDKGDIMLLELQAIRGTSTDGVPVTAFKAIQDVVRAATNKGIIVIAAAGNGEANLDKNNNITVANYRKRSDDKSIVVGASDIFTRSRKDFSTYGKRINVFSYGERVSTTDFNGYRSFRSSSKTPLATYTREYSGTSSASALVAAAAAVIQSYAKNKLKTALSPLEMRRLMVATGNSQKDRLDSYFCGGGRNLSDPPCTPAQANSENFKEFSFTAATAAAEPIGKFVNVANAVGRLKRRKLAGIRRASKSITETKNSITVYPNPVKDLLQINGISNTTKSTLYNLEGQTMATFNSNKINLETYTPGHYLLKIEIDHNSFTTKSIIVE